MLGAGVMGAGIAQVMAIAGHGWSATTVARRAGEGPRARRHRALRRPGRGRARAPHRATRPTRRSPASTSPPTSTPSTRCRDRDRGDPGAAGPQDRRVPRARPPGGADTVLASNSSGFPIAASAAATDRPDRVVGWHWASPAPVMRFAEIVRAPATSRRDRRARGRARPPGRQEPDRRASDNPMAWGYVANRMYGAMVREARQVSRRGRRHPGGDRPADGRLLPLADRALRDDPRRPSGWSSTRDAATAVGQALARRRLVRAGASAGSGAAGRRTRSAMRSSTEGSSMRSP